MIRIGNKDCLFIDAHTHVWDKIHGTRFNGVPNVGLDCGKTLLGDQVVQFMPPPFTNARSSIEIYETYMELSGVDKAVLLQTPCYGPQSEYLNEIIAKNPGKYVTVGVSNPQDKETYIRDAELFLGTYGYKGMKFEMPDIPFDLTDPKNAFIFETIAKYDAYCMVDMGWGNGPDDYPIEKMKEIVKRYKNLTFVFPHLGVSRLWDPKEQDNFDALKNTLSMLESNEHVWFDLSGIPMMVESFDEYPYPTIQRALKAFKDTAGMAHLMWGTDYPCVTKVCTYQQCIDYVLKHCDFITNAEMEALFGTTAQKVWFD